MSDTIDLSTYDDIETSTDPARNTHLEYMYRDASNYKQAGAQTFAGPPTPELVKRLLKAMPGNGDSIASFVPDQVGMPDMCQEMPGSYDDDSGWHELTAIEATKGSVDDERTFEQFVLDCESIVEWDDEPRISYDLAVYAANGYGQGPARQWMLGRDDIWFAVTTTVEEFAAKQGVEPAQVQVSTIKAIPKTGALRWGNTPVFPPPGTPQGVVTDVTTGTPGELGISAEDVREATGRSLSQTQLVKLRELLLADTGRLVALAAEASGEEVFAGDNLSQWEDIVDGQGEVRHCGCGYPVTEYDGEWYHVINDGLAGTGDHDPNPDDDDA